MTYIFVFVFQVLFNIFKVLEIRYTLHHQLRKLLVNSIYINLVSLGAMFYSLEALLKGNFIVIIFYIAGSVVGKYIGMGIDVKKGGSGVQSYLY